MDAIGPPLIFFAVVCLVIVIGVYSFIAERRRREAFQVIARQLGLRCHTGKDRTIAQRYQFLDDLRKGRSRYARNVMEGVFEGHPVLAFDYHYTTGSGKNTEHHQISFFILEQELDFPELRIYPEDVLSKLGQMIGFEDIDFESAEFSRAFCIRSKDKKFAYDICNAGMIEFLLGHKDYSIEIEGHCVAMSFSRRLDPQDIPGKLRDLVTIRSHFPEYLYRA
jgi:hypothetical protein